MGTVTIPGDVSVGQTGHVTHHDAIHLALAGAASRRGVTVASADSPDSAKAIADYVCDGVADQVQINAALVDASRPNDGFGGNGMIEVILVGATFDISDSIKMPATTTLSGGGRGTLIRPPTGSYVDKGAIELLNANCHRVTVRDLTIGRHNATKHAWHGIKFIGNATGSTYEIVSANDSYVCVERVFLPLPNGKGIWIGGISGANGMREAQVRDCVVTNGVLEGIHIDGASDSKINQNVVTGVDGAAPGIRVEGGNTMTANCKVFYRGNSATPHQVSGFVISSSRCQVYGNEAQDNAYYGFEISSADAAVSGNLADSNGAKYTTGGGFLISGDGVYDGLGATTRPQNTYHQNRGIVFSGSPQVMLTGRVNVDSGTDHVVGSPGANSFVRVVRSGTTLHSVG